MDLTIERFDLDERVREPNTRRDSPADAPFPTDFPFIVDDDTQRIVEPLALHLDNKFNHDGCFKGSVWTKASSAANAAADLKAWWTFIHKHPSGPTWDNVSDGILAAYLNAMRRTPSRKTGNFLDPDTIRRHCSSIDAFNAFAKTRWPNGRFPSMNAAKVLAGFGAATRDHASDEFPRPLTDENVKAVSAKLGPRPADRRPKQSSRTRLAFTIAVQVGLRIDEIVNLRAATFERMRIAPEQRMKATPLRIHKTKGLKPRTVYFPNWLVLQLQTYIAGERAESLERGRALWIKHAAEEPPNLLLNRPDARGRNPGKEATADSLQDDFHSAIMNLELTTTRPVLVGTPQETEVTVPLHTFHDGRHTYAHWTFDGLLSQGKKVDAAWLLLRNRLGHKRLQTTIDTYLRAFSEGDESTIDLLVEHLAARAAEANP